MALIDFADAALPSSGDFNPGAGMSTSSRTNSNALVAQGQTELVGTMVNPSALGTPLGHPIGWWLGIIGVLIITKFASERSGHEGEFSNIRIGFWNVAVITGAAIVGLILTKWVFGVYKIPGLSAIVEAA